MSLVTRLLQLHCILGLTAFSHRSIVTNLLLIPCVCVQSETCCSRGK